MAVIMAELRQGPHALSRLPPALNTVTFEADYNNRARVPDHPAVMAAWKEAAGAYRQARPPRVIAYGQGPRETIDLFLPPGGGGGLAAFFHGGYWQALDPSWFSHLAAGLNAHGHAVAIVGYDLCPKVPLARIVDQAHAAMRTLAEVGPGPLTAFGHSAGGHLVACLLSQPPGTGQAPDLPLSHGLAISGLFDLEPLTATSINGALALDVATARSLSPLYWPPRPGITLELLVGEDESAAFHDQSLRLARAWGGLGARVTTQVLAGANHFTVLAPFADPDSDWTGRLRAHLATA